MLDELTSQSEPIGSSRDFGQNGDNGGKLMQTILSTMFMLTSLLCGEKASIVARQTYRAKVHACNFPKVENKFTKVNNTNL